ncbi:MBL fold metallo-hydrolase [Aureimonas sp. AU4]|uniref:MBL fold metallo-hydrolase n=1 Tax=Aureimonas sp. AU4 TaxID=1638163 RepID=UPI0007807190|nr:MBL fold metallo-hydrolase [Aureimonas sp. AU4]
MSSVELATYPGLDERVSVLRLGETVDAVFVRTARFDVLVDTLDTPETCRAALDLVAVEADRPLIVVNSHMDWDHFWGNAAVAGRSAIIAHANAAVRFKDAGVREVLRRKSSEDSRFADVELCAPTMTFTDRVRLEGGDLTLELLHTPGHTPDHVAVWIPELRTCLAVDAVERPIPKVWSDDPEDLRSLVSSLRLIESLEARHVVLAHGHTDSPSVAGRNLRYFETLARRVGELGRAVPVAEGSDLPNGLELSDIVDGISELSEPMRRFYDRFHRANLRATIRSVHGAGSR